MRFRIFPDRNGPRPAPTAVPCRDYPSLDRQTKPLTSLLHPARPYLNLTANPHPASAVDDKSHLAPPDRSLTAAPNLIHTRLVIRRPTPPLVDRPTALDPERSIPNLTRPIRNRQTPPDPAGNQPSLTKTLRSASSHDRRTFHFPNPDTPRTTSTAIPIHSL